MGEIVGTHDTFYRGDNVDIQIERNFWMSEMAIPKDSKVDAGAIVFNRKPFSIAQAIRDKANRAVDYKEDISMLISSGYRTMAKHFDIYKGRDREAPPQSHHLNLTIHPWTAFDFIFMHGGSLHHKKQLDAIEAGLKYMLTEGGVYYIGAGYWHVDGRKDKWRGNLE